MYRSSTPPSSNWWLSWPTTQAGSGSPWRNSRTSAESRAVKSAAGIPLPTTSPTATAQHGASPGAGGAGPIGKKP